jgi:eukaryotic-like serine/threonine-protein kinase
MSEPQSVDESLVQSLPLPLAKLVRRARNAKTPLDRHQAAYYLWECTLKLCAVVAIAEYIELNDRDPAVAELLTNLSRPALGHWWEFVRRLVPLLAQAGDGGFIELRDVLLGRARDDMPRAAGLHVALIEHHGQGKAPARATVRLTELFDRLVTYRNHEIGHGAWGKRSGHFYDPMARALLEGVSQILEMLPVLAGRRLIYVGEVRRQSSADWLVERYELKGESARRIESLCVPERAAAALPRPDRAYLERDESQVLSGRSQLLSLDPLIHVRLESEQVFFLNARRNKRQAEYLCYQDGEQWNRDTGADQCELLSRILRSPVVGTEVDAWAARSQAEEAGEAALANGHETPERTIGEYELLGRLGQGGMGVVYRAWQPSLGRQVALKCMLRSGDPKAEARFSREIRALGRVEHPGIVKVFTSGAEADHWFFVMELVEGTDLAQVCDQLTGRNATDVDDTTWREALSSACAAARSKEVSLSSSHPGAQREGKHHGPSEESGGRESSTPREIFGAARDRNYIALVVGIIRQVAEAAHALHEAGVVHRDIKPGNIMISEETRAPILMDLGLAQLADETDGRLTRTRQFVGTLRYASPEQVLAAGKVDRRSDVYSLGATLWELLALRPLFGATDQTPTPELMLKIQSAEPGSPRKYNPHVPRDLEAIVQTSLEKDRTKRYATAMELADDLGRFLDRQPVHARPVGQVERGWRWCRRNPARVALGVLGVLALISGVALLISSRFAAQQARSASALRREKAQTEKALALAEEQERLAQDYRHKAERLSAQMTLRSGIAHGEEGNGGRGILWMTRSLEVCPGSAPDLERSIRTAIGATARSLLSLEALFSYPSPTNIVVFSPDGKSLLFGGKQPCLIDVSTGGPRAGVTISAHGVSGAAFSPDGRRFATAAQKGLISIADAATGEVLGAAVSQGGTVKSVVFSPDGRSLLVAAQFEGSLRCYDVETRQATSPAFLCRDNLYSAAYSPDGRYVITAAIEKNARLWDAQTGKPVGSPLVHPGVVFAASFSPDGQFVVTGCIDGGVRIWEFPSGKLITPVLHHKGPVRSACFNYDGRRVLTTSEDGTARLWDVATAQPVGQPLSHPSELRSAAFSPDRTHLVTAGFEGTARLWRLPSAQALPRILAHPGAVAAIAFSPDGTKVLTGCHDSQQLPGESQLWDAATGRQLGPALRQEGQVTAVAFNPDGSLALSAGNDRNARLWSTSLGSAVQKPWSYGNIVAAIAFSPNGKLAAMAGREGLVQLRDVTNGKIVSSWQAYGRDMWVWSVAFTPDGQRLLTSGGFDARLWSIPGGTRIGQLMEHQGGVRMAELSPDGQMVLTGSLDKTARIWSARDGAPLSPPLPHKGDVRCGAFRRDGRVVATGSADGTVRLWEAPTGRSLIAPLVHDGWVRSLAFSPHGKTLVTGCDDGTARLWNTDDGTPLGAVLHHRGPVNAVAFSPDGKIVLTASSDGTARLWTPPHPIEGDPARATLWAEVLTGMELDSDGTVQVLAGDAWRNKRGELDALGGPPGPRF